MTAGIRPVERSLFAPARRASVRGNAFSATDFILSLVPANQYLAGCLHLFNSFNLFNQFSGEANSFYRR